jgi:hypothetical protein
MPGYPSLPESISGVVADLTRDAARLEEQGHKEDAAAVYERAVQAVVASGEAIPGFLCGRLALLYRRLGRHAEEVVLIEQYQATQRIERDRVRFDARLSKARALLERASRSQDSGALASIRGFKPSSYMVRKMRRTLKDAPSEPT